VTRSQREWVIIESAPQVPCQGSGLVIRKFEDHTGEMVRLTIAAKT
jgi:hypothetical protein